MFDVCKILQLQIDRYKRVLAYGFDAVTEERLKAAVAELEKRMAELHPKS
jgi:hypothetical protein